MGGRGSGGANRKPIDLHLLQGTYKPSRHGTEPPEAPLSAADRRRALAGLSQPARRLAGSLLDTYGDWDAASLATLRLYAESVARLAAITEDSERRRETRVMLLLLKSLELERAK